MSLVFFNHCGGKKSFNGKFSCSFCRYTKSLESVNKTLDEHSRKLNAIQLNLDKMAFAPPAKSTGDSPFHLRSLNVSTLFYILFGLLVHTLFMWLFLSRK